MSPTSPPILNYTQIRGAADKFLEKYHPALSIPIPIEEIVELDLKMRISTIPNLRSELDVDGFVNSSFDEITLDDKVFNDFEERTRFTIAHELGHLFLHSEIYNSFKIASKENYRNFQNSISQEDQKWLEIQAHIFAACTLVPTRVLKEEIAKAVGEKSPQADYSIPFLGELPARFKVSTEVLYRRIQKERLLKETL